MYIYSGFINVNIFTYVDEFEWPKVYRYIKGIKNH